MATPSLPLRADPFQRELSVTPLAQQQPMQLFVGKKSPRAAGTRDAPSARNTWHLQPPLLPASLGSCLRPAQWWQPPEGDARAAVRVEPHAIEPHAVRVEPHAVRVEPHADREDRTERPSARRSPSAGLRVPSKSQSPVSDLCADSASVGAFPSAIAPADRLLASGISTPEAAPQGAAELFRFDNKSPPPLRCTHRERSRPFSCLPSLPSPLEGDMEMLRVTSGHSQQSVVDRLGLASPGPGRRGFSASLSSSPSRSPSPSHAKFPYRRAASARSSRSKAEHADALLRAVTDPTAAFIPSAPSTPSGRSRSHSGSDGLKTLSRPRMKTTSLGTPVRYWPGHLP